MTKQGGLSPFERYLSVWVALCILAGIGIGWLFPAFPELLMKAEGPISPSRWRSSSGS
jgi:ACR3 family arsenite transporter